MILEFGVFKGTTISMLANHFPNKTIHGFDSFEGLPEDWNRPDIEFNKGCFTTNGIPPILPYKNIEYHVGWFDRTLPDFLKIYESEKMSLIHMDVDIYSSCKYVLSNIKKHLQPGTVIVFDELINYPTYELHEMKALHEFLIENPTIKVEMIGGRGAFRKTCNTGVCNEQSVAVRITSI